jgi:signal transduction histidine kinase
VSFEEFGFSFAGRTIDYFGSKAITSDITALFELIKNSRDANAKTVTVHFKDLTKNNASIEIYDDGDGMSEQDVREKWMVIGTDSRLNNNTTKNGKPVWGEMGIGRIACQKLGGVTEMDSVKNSKYVKMVFDWSVFEKPGITVDKIRFPVETGSGKGLEHGVTLELKKLKSPWNSKKINDLKEELSVLISQDNFDDLKIKIKVGNEGGEFIGKNYAKIRDKVTSNAPFKLRAKFDGSNLSVDISAHVGQRGTWEPQIVMGAYDKTVVGPFTVDIFHFPRAPGKQKTSTIETYYDKKIGIDKLSSFLKHNYGPYLYRDGAWMKPYGGENDWLGMEASARQETSKIGIKQIYGQVQMSKKKNPEIRPASHRETLIENEAFGNLKTILAEIFEILRHYMSDWKKEDNKKTISDMGSDSVTPEETLPLIYKQITKLSASLPEDKKKHLKTSLNGIISIAAMKDEKSEKQLLDMGQMRDWEKNLATLGIATSYMAREITHPLEENMETLAEAEDIMADLEKTDWKLPPETVKHSWEMIESMKDNQGKMAHFMKFVDVLSNHISQSIRSSKRSTQVDVLKCWETVSNGFQSKKEELDIEITDDWTTHTKNTGSKLVVKLDRIDLECILTNLYLNSIESLSKIKSKKRKVTFNYWYKDNALNIEFSDNGIGIPKKKMEEVFEPFKFGHNENNDEKHGHGLGLHIVKQIMANYDGTAIALDVDEGAKIWIRFPDVSKVAT